MQEIWYTKHRSKTLDDYVFINEFMEKKVRDWVSKGQLPHHLLLSGNPGCGKTTLAYLLAEQLGYEDVDVKKISASVKRKAEDIFDDVIGFVERQSHGPQGRLVILDEADTLSPLYQDILRNLVGNEEGSSQVRFILTCNYPHKIKEALKSRLTHFSFDSLDYETFVLRLAKILISEDVKFDNEVLKEYADKYYPDMRKAIDKLEFFTIDGELHREVIESADQSPDWMKEVIVMFQDGNISDARKHCVKNIGYEDYEDFYKLLYENLEWFGGDNPDKQDAALMAIKDAYVDDKAVASREIVLSACLVKLNRIRHSDKR